MLNTHFLMRPCGACIVSLVMMPTWLWAQAPSDKPKSKNQLTFEVYQDTAKEYRWRLISGAGKERQVLATGGQGYKEKADCLHGVKSIQEGRDKLTFETYEDQSKENRWRAKAPNGQIVAASVSSYKTKAECDQAIQTIKKDATKATVQEVKVTK
jgi:uncharacterized protein YegP (UPF0339 family)